MSITLDGTTMELLPPDLDKDGIVGGTEMIQKRAEDITEIKQPTELGESMDKIMQDDLDINTRMSGIDMRSRLHFVEIAPILAIDTLVTMRVLSPSVLSFTRQKKRLSVSLSGLGRKEMVDLAVGKKEKDQEKQQGFFSRMFGRKDQQQMQ